jgi:hypothetical protein
MDLSKLRRGELIAAIGGIVLLFALLFLNWYAVSIETPLANFSIGGNLGAWDSQGFLGTLANLVILAAGIAAVGLAVLTAMSRTVALPVAASALTAGLGIAAVALVLGRMLFQPGPNEIVDLEFGIFIAFAGALAVAIGGWQSMQEEGTTFDQAREQLEDRFGDRGPVGAAAPGRETGTGPEQGGGFPSSSDEPAGGSPPAAPPPSEGPPPVGE